MSKKQKKKTTLSLDFNRLPGDDVRAMSESTVGNIEPDEPVEKGPPPAPPAEPEKPKEPFQGMYYPLGR